MGELTSGGRPRRLALSLPRTGSGDGIPLVIVLHGNHPDATGQMMRDWTTFDEQAGAFGFAVAYPDGIGGCWADGRGVTTADEAGVDDVAFLRALIDTVAGRHGTHLDRTVVAGMSNGAFMAHRIALEASEKVAVFAAVAGGLPASLCDTRPGPPRPAPRNSTPPRRSAFSPSPCSRPRTAGDCHAPNTFAAWGVGAGPLCPSIVPGARCRAAAIVAIAKAAESGPQRPFPLGRPRVLKVARVPEHNWRMTVPYHADVIGSLLRPRYLSEARAALTAGRMSNTEFKRIEDRAVDQAIALQEGCGLDVVNDGELRRFSFLDHLLGDMEGVADMPGAPVHFHAPDPAQDWNWHPPFTVTGRIRPKGPMMTIEEFSYARGRARVPVKITMPSPLVMYGAWSPEHSRPAYSDAFELFADAADIIRAEAAELARLGCTYIQIDSPDLGTLVDPENRALREGLGMDTERTLTEGVDIINSVADVPGVTFGLHICKGNYESKWIATGGYEFTADKVFARSGNFDVFLLEYDDERSGSFEPLANVPDDKVVVLGLVSSKLPGIEPADELIARIDEAAGTSAKSGSRCPPSAGSHRCPSAGTSSARRPSSASSSWSRRWLTGSGSRAGARIRLPAAHRCR